MYVSTNPLIENIRPPNSRKARGRGLRYYYIVLPAGTVTDKKVSGLIPAYDNPDVRGVCKQSHISGLGIAGGNSGQVYSDIPIAVTGKSRIAERPVNHAGTIQAKGPVCTSGGTPCCRNLLKRTPSAVPADGAAFSTPVVIDLSNQR